MEFIESERHTCATDGIWWARVAVASLASACHRIRRCIMRTLSVGITATIVYRTTICRQVTASRAIIWAIRFIWTSYPCKSHWKLSQCWCILFCNCKQLHSSMHRANRLHDNRNHHCSHDNCLQKSQSIDTSSRSNQFLEAREFTCADHLWAAASVDISSFATALHSIRCRIMRTDRTAITATILHSATICESNSLSIVMRTITTSPLQTTLEASPVFV